MRTRTALPIEALGRQALARAKETAELCDKLLASHSGGYLGIWPVTLTADGWADCTDVPGYAYKQTAELRAAREATSPPPYPPRDLHRGGGGGACRRLRTGAVLSPAAENVPEGGHPDAGGAAGTLGLDR